MPKKSSEQLQKARDYEVKYAPFIKEEDRPVYHLSPYIGWMNDPNGFSVYQGKYHLFYQYYPYETRWNSMHWGHAVTEDFLHWEYLPCALAPDQEYDGFGVFSGGALELPDGRQMLVYTGVRKEMQEDGRTREVQTQCAAVGDGLNYEKLPQNPILNEFDLPEGGDRYDFRDPKVWVEEDGTYAMVVGNRPADGSGSILLYRSKDAVKWELDCILDQSYNEFGKMWECPDFFPLDGKHVILTSPQDMSPSGLEFHSGNGTLCLIGNYSRAEKVFERELVQSIDYGIDFYAPQTLLTPDGRRVMIAWMQNWDTTTPPSPEVRWFCQMTTPRELSIQNGRLYQNPVRELESLRGRKVAYKNVVIAGEETSLRGVYGRVLDMTVTIHPSDHEVYQQFTMKIAKGSQHYTKIVYKPHTSVLRINRAFSGSCRDHIHERKLLVPNEKGEIKLRILLDRFSVEIFVNDGAYTSTTTIYTPLTADGISFEANGQLQMDVEKYDLKK